MSQGVLGQSRLLLLTAVTFAIIGAWMWKVMPRQEDPEIVSRWGTVSVTFQGADPESVERLVIEPIEDALADVDEIRFLDAEASEGFAYIGIALYDSVGPGDIDSVWKDIEDAVARVEADLPAGADEPYIDHGLSDVEAVVLAITGSDDPLVLRHAALDLRETLLDVSQVSRIRVIGDPGEEVVIGYDEATAAALGVSRGRLAGLLQARNVLRPAGSVLSGEKRATLTPRTEFRDLEDIEATPIPLPGGTAVPLSSVASIRRGPEAAAPEMMRFRGQRAVGLGIIAQNEGNIVTFGKSVREKLAALRPEYAPLSIEEVTFQPDRVQERIDGLGDSLLMSMLVVGGLVLWSMGARMGIVVTLVVPLVVFSSLAFYAVAGGVLHQMSVAALVIALGMLVDNAIVVVESMIRRLDEGESHQEAAIGAVRELALPLFTATGTTVAAFVPMLLAEGAVGEFTRAIPILVTIVLVVSYVYAILVTPLIARWVLRPSKSTRSFAVERFSLMLGRVAMRRYHLVIGVVLGALAGVAALAPLVEQNFFPGSDRNELLVTLELPDGSRIETIDDAAQTVESVLGEHPRVTSVAAFIGRSAPHFYYNVPTITRAPHFAQLLVTTRSEADNAEVGAFVRSVAEDRLPGVSVIAAPLEQGPGSAAPIEVRLRGDDMEDLRQAAQTLGAALEKIEGTRSVRDNMSLGIPNVDLRVDDAAAAAYGIARGDVSDALFGTTRGYAVGSVRTGDDDPVPVLLRSPAGEWTPIESLGGVEIDTPSGTFVPLAQFVHFDVAWRPARYRRRDGKRSVAVLANLREGVPYSVVVSELHRQLDSLDLPPNVTVSLGGEAEGAGDANAAMAAALPIGFLMLVGFLMVEFNSFRRVLIVLATVPLAAVGVIPGLIVGQQPFGFMSVLGVVALAGVVVNNAIVLLDVVEQRRRQGATIEEALVDSIGLRIRPILLTTGTTVAGLLPLAFSGAALWPPLAWAMISGLVASSVLTLVFVPALYRAIIRS